MNTILMDRINILGRANSLGLREESLKGFKVNELKETLSEINKSIEGYNICFQRKLLKSKTLQETFEKGDEILNRALEFISDSNKITPEEALNYSEELKFLYLLNQKLKKECRNNYYYASRSILPQDTAAYIIKFHSKENLTNEQLKSLFSKIYGSSLYGVFTEKFNKLSEDRKLDFIGYLRFCLVLEGSNDMNNIMLEFLQSDKETFKIREYLYNNGFGDISIKKQINADEIIAVLEKIKAEVDEEAFIELLDAAFRFKSADIFELNCVLTNILNGNKLAVFNSYEDYLSFAYSRLYKYSGLLFVPDMLTTSHIDLIRSAIRNKKKAFLKLINFNFEDFSKLPNDNILFNVNFQKVININTLNLNNLKELTCLKVPSKEFWNILSGMSLTFNELKMLCAKCDFIVKLYTKLTIPKVDAKLIVLSQLPCVSEDSFESFNMSQDDILDGIAKNLSLKSLSKWMDEMNLNIKKESYLKILAQKDLFVPYLKDIKNDSDVNVIMKTRNFSIENKKSLKDLKRAYFQSSDEFSLLINKLDLTPEFILSNEEGIFSFIDRGLVEVYKSLSASSSIKRENLKFITKAELAGKLDKIKFYGNDLIKEIGYDISTEQLELWKQNLESKKGNISIKETFDFNTTIRLGQYPVETCMHWNGGAFNECLLSNFDSNKKLLAIYDGEKIIGRSILRLTKGSRKYSKNENETSLKFRDITEIDAIEQTQKEDNKKSSDEQLVLFIERPYFTGKNDAQLLNIYKDIVRLIAKKAKEMGAQLVVSSPYNKAVKELDFDAHNENYYIFISYSKNGSQYLDSLSGKNTISSEGSYKSANLYVINC